MKTLRRRPQSQFRSNGEKRDWKCLRGMEPQTSRNHPYTQRFGNKIYLRKPQNWRLLFSAAEATDLHFSPLSRLSSASAHPQPPRFVWPTLPHPGLACLSRFLEHPAGLAFPAAAQASPDPLAAATIWPLGSPSLQAILNDAGGEALAGSVGEPRSDRKAGSAAVPAASSDLHAPLR